LAEEYESKHHEPEGEKTSDEGPLAPNP